MTPGGDRDDPAVRPGDDRGAPTPAPARDRGAPTGTPAVSFADSEPNGRASLLGGLLAQNLAREPARGRGLRPALVAIRATDAGVAATVRLAPEGVAVANGADPAADVALEGPAEALLALSRAPLLLGVPDPRSREGRAVLTALARRRIRVRGLFRRPGALRSLARLLSVGDEGGRRGR